MRDPLCTDPYPPEIFCSLGGGASVITVEMLERARKEWREKQREKARKGAGKSRHSICTRLCKWDVRLAEAPAGDGGAE